MKPKNKTLAIAALLLLLLTQASQRLLFGQSDPMPRGSEPILVVCDPDKLFPNIGEPVTLRAYVNEGDPNGLSYTWSATGGKIADHKQEVVWNLKGVRPKTYAATVEVKDSKGRTGRCTAEVTIIAPLNLKGAKRITGRAFLLKGEQEAEGYGLYSYILFGKRPDESSKAVYLTAIKEYLRLSDVTDLLERRREKKGINITYLPLRTAPPQELLKKIAEPDDRNYADASEWILTNYDYPRAEVLLAKVDGDHGRGPIIVSFLKPLSDADSVKPPILYQNLSPFSPGLVLDYMNLFTKQAAQEKFWKAPAMDALALKLKVYLGYVGRGLPEVTGALVKVIKIQDGLKLGS